MQKRYATPKPKSQKLTQMQDDIMIMREELQSEGVEEVEIREIIQRYIMEHRVV